MPLERHVYERLFIQETLLDLVLDVASMLGAMEVIWQECCHTKTVTFADWSWSMLQSVESRLETVSSMAKQVDRLLPPTSTEVVVFRRRISRACHLVTSLREEIVGSDDESDNEGNSTTSAVDEENVYDRAAAVWRSGLHRDDKVNRRVLGELSQAQQVYVVTKIGTDGNSTVGLSVDYEVDSQEESCTDDEVDERE